MIGYNSLIFRCFGSRAASEERTANIVHWDTACRPVVDTLTSQAKRWDLALSALQEVTVPSSHQALKPTSASSTWALSSARIPGGGFVAASSDGVGSHLSAHGKVLQTFRANGNYPVYSLCMLDAHHVLGNCRTDSSQCSLKAWDLRTYQLVGECPARAMYTNMAHLGHGLVVAAHSQASDVWLHNLADGNLRCLEGVDSNEAVGRFAVLGEGHVAAQVRRGGQTAEASHSIITWHRDRDWQAQRVTLPADVATPRSLVPLAAGRLLVLGIDPNQAAVWHIDRQQWETLNSDVGVVVGHRWVEPSAEHAARCANYDASRICGGVNPHALSCWQPHMFLEPRGDSSIAWDLGYGTPAWQGTSLVVRPSGPTFGSTLEVLELTC